MEPSGVAGPATSDSGAPDEVVASVADGVGSVGACGADQGVSRVWIRRARVSGSGGGASSLSPSGVPRPGNEEPRRWSVGGELVRGGTDAVPIACDKSTPVSGVARRDVLSAMSGVALRDAGLVVVPVRERCCGGVRGGGGDGEEVPRCGALRVVVFRAESAASGGEGEVDDVDWSQDGGGNSGAFWSAFPFSCLAFLPNLTNCSKA